MNKIGKLGFSVIFGGIFLVSLFSYAKGTEVSTPSIDNSLSSAKIADEKALARYFELLERYPKLKGEGELNGPYSGYL